MKNEQDIRNVVCFWEKNQIYIPDRDGAVPKIFVNTINLYYEIYFNLILKIRIDAIVDTQFVYNIYDVTRYVNDIDQDDTIEENNIIKTIDNFIFFKRMIINVIFSFEKVEKGRGGKWGEKISNSRFVYCISF